ncbi:MAG: hypothetical protein ACR2P9_07695 [Gammaproteobacteria bacterium]
MIIRLFACVAVFVLFVSPVAAQEEQYRLATEQGDTIAQFNLRVMYRNSEGVPRDGC